MSKVPSLPYTVGENLLNHLRLRDERDETVMMPWSGNRRPSPDPHGGNVGVLKALPRFIEPVFFRYSQSTAHSACRSGD